jgi:CSLREA domain-containing protein
MRPILRLRRSLSLSLLEDRSVPTVFTVNALTDTGTGTGTSGDLRYCMTQAQAAISPGADTINFDPTLFATPQTITLTSVLPTIDDALTINGTGSANVILDLNNTSMTAPFVTDATFPATGAAVHLTGFTMKNANSTGDMYVTFKDANATFTDIQINNGVTSSANARALNFSASAPGTFTPTVTLTNCSVSGTTATFVPVGTGVYYFSGAVTCAGVDVSISGSNISNNLYGLHVNPTASGSGMACGGIDMNGNSAADGGAAGGNSLSITNSTIDGDTQWYHGAVAVHGSVGALTITNTHIDNNTGGTGAGIFCSAGTTLVNITSSSVSGNTAATTNWRGYAGGMYLNGCSTCTINSSSFVSNSGKGGLAGAMWLDNFPATGVFHAINTTISNNFSNSSGGACRLGQANQLGTQFIYDNCTIANNTESNGALRHFFGSIVMNSSIMDGNTGAVPNIADFNTAGLVPSIIHSTLYNPTTVSAGTPGITTDATDILNTSALLNPPSDNGAGLLTQLPGTGSPVIGKGTNALALTYDERGSAANPAFTRNAVKSGPPAVDMGAIQAVVFTPFVQTTVTDGTVTANNVHKYNFNITYADNAFDINTGSLATGNVTVTGPSYSGGINATFDHFVAIDTKHVQAFYYFFSPGTFFVPADNGTYALKIAATAGNKVLDTNGGFVPAGNVANVVISVGQVFTVTTTADETDPSDGVVSLREAIAAANASPATDTIAFDPSVFSSPQTISLSLGQIVVSDSVVINNPGGHLTIDGTSNGTAGCFYLNGPATFSLTNLTISGFNDSGAGGAIDMVTKTLATFTNCTFDNNKGSQGGALWLDDGTMTITGCQFTNNTSTGTGGAMYLRIGNVTIDSSTLANNTASGGSGGAIDVNFNQGFAVSLKITNSTVSNNSASGGGGAVFGRDMAAFLISNSTVTGNTSNNGTGGALYEVMGNYQAGYTTIRNSTINSNMATGTAGAGSGGLMINQIQTTPDPINIISTILAGNTMPGSPDYAGPTTAVFDHSLLGTANSFTPSSAALTAGNNKFGSDATPLDPALGPLLSNGAAAGAPLTELPLVGSPVADSGSNPAPALSFDERGSGFPRTHAGDPAPDIGAVDGTLLLPVGKMTAIAPIVTPGPTPNSVTVTYSDDIAINVGTIDVTDIQILDPTMAPLTITGVTVDPPAGNGTPRVAHYTFTVPTNAAAGWDASDNGTYTVNLLAGSVADTEGDTNVAQTLGTFKANMPFVYTVVNNLDNGAAVTATTGDLRYCINQANADGGTSIINFDPTFFTGGANNIIAMTQGVAYTVNETSALTINGPASHVTLNAGGLDRVMDLSGSTAGIAIAMSNLTFTNGAKSGGSTQGSNWGGGILLGGDSLTLTNCTVSNNTVTGTSSANNVLTGARGGGIALSVAASNLTLNNCVVSGNTSTSSNASGYNDGVGGGIGTYQGAAATTVILNNTTVSGNSSSWNGGGVYFANNGGFQANSSTISGNTAGGGGQGGGGMYFFGAVGTAGFLISNSTFSGNSAAAHGGGLEFYPNTATAGTAVIQNSTFSGNKAGGTGGGIYHYPAASAGTSGTISISSTIVAGNSAGGSGSAATADIGSSKATSFAGNNNLIGVQDAANLVTLSGSGNLTGTTATPLDAKLGALALNGAPAGSPLTQGLNPGSPALNAGNNTAGLLFDERGTGFNRTSGAGTDIGAFEVQVATPPPTVTNLKIDDGTVQRSMIDSLTVTFSEAVTFTGAIANAFHLHRDSAPPPGPGAEQGGVTGNVNLAAAQVGSVVTLTFLSSGANPINGVGGNGIFSLPDGRYTLTIDHTQVVGVGGNMASDYVLASAPAPAAPTNIFRFFGDVTGDGSVTNADFSGVGGAMPITGFKQAFGGPDHRFDYNGDGSVAASDFAQFRIRFGGLVP